MKDESEPKEAQPCQPHLMIRDRQELTCANCGEKFRETSPGNYVQLKEKASKKGKSAKASA